MTATKLLSPPLSFVFRRDAALGDATFLQLLVTTMWMTLCYSIWWAKFSTYDETAVHSALDGLLGFLPLLVWAMYDYRKGLLLTVMATPLLIAPIIPKTFTQGFGDLFALCTLAGFLLRHPNLRSWLVLWRPGYIWLVLILVAAVISLIGAAPPQTEVHYGIKYGIAEMAGYVLDFSFLVILVYELRDRKDVKALLCAAGAGGFMVLVFSIIGLNLSLRCAGGISGMSTALTSNQSIGSTFGNPNYHAAYLLTLLPLLYLLYLQKNFDRARHVLIAALIIATTFFIQASMSRAAFFVMIVLFFAWIVITHARSGTRILSALLALLLCATTAIWWYPTCTCPDVPKDVCPYQFSSNIISQPAQGSTNEKLKVFNKALAVSLARTPKAEGGWKDKTRLQLAENAIHIWKEHPLTGVGVGLMANYSFASGQANRAHNMLLTIGAEQGIVGVLAWLGWVVHLIKLLWQHRFVQEEDKHKHIFLGIALCVLLLEAQFMDFYRMLWVWQIAALVIAWPAVYGGARQSRKARHAGA